MGSSRRSLLGVHCSVSGGLHLGIKRIMDLKARALQIFTRNQRQWNPAPLDENEIILFRQAWEKWGNYPILSHNSYLINLASPDKNIQKRSIAAQARELERCALLGIKMLVTHPGANKGQGIEKGIKTFVKALDKSMGMALFLCPESSGVKVLIETTSGQGTGLGSRFEELAAIIGTSRFSDRLGVCLDTCHIFAAGYDLRDIDTYNETMNSLDKLVGLERVEAVHLNDSRNPLGSRVDRHEHIGRGEIGLEAFRLILNDKSMAKVPMVLETPKDRSGKWDRKNLRVLRGLISRQKGSDSPSVR